MAVAAIKPLATNIDLLTFFVPGGVARGFQPKDKPKTAVRATPAIAISCALRELRASSTASITDVPTNDQINRETKIVATNPLLEDKLGIISGK